MQQSTVQDAQQLQQRAELLKATDPRAAQLLLQQADAILRGDAGLGPPVMAPPRNQPLPPPIPDISPAPGPGRPAPHPQPPAGATAMQYRQWAIDQGMTPSGIGNYLVTADQRYLYDPQTRRYSPNAQQIPIGQPPTPGPGIGRQPYGNDNIMGSVKPPSPVTPSRTDFRPPPIRTELPPGPPRRIVQPRQPEGPYPQLPEPTPSWYRQPPRQFAPDMPSGPARPSSEPWWKSNIRRRTQGTLRSSATAPRRYAGGGQVMANGRFPLPSAAQIAAMSPEQKMQQGPQLLSNIRMGLRPSSYYNMPGSVREGMSGIVSALGMPEGDFFQGLEQGYPQGVNPAQGITAGFNRGGKVKVKKGADGSFEYSEG